MTLTGWFDGYNRTLPKHLCPGGGMVDALASGASTGNGVEVRVLSWAPAVFFVPMRFNAVYSTFPALILNFQSALRICIAAGVCNTNSPKISLKNHSPH